MLTSASPIQHCAHCSSASSSRLVGRTDERWRMLSRAPRRAEDARILTEVQTSRGLRSIIGLRPVDRVIGVLTRRGFSSRGFASTARWRTAPQGHYQTLGVPSNASTAQIKNSFYKLSKQYHPDLNKNPAAKAKFQAVSEAWDVLGDDRKRRAYDRSVTDSGATARTHAFGQDSPHSHWSHETHRRRGATHAWETHPRRPSPGSYTRPGKHYERPGGTDPFESPNVRRATGMGHARAAGAEMRAEARAREEHRARSESGLWRVAQVVGVVLVVAMFGGGTSASA